MGSHDEAMPCHDDAPDKMAAETNKIPSQGDMVDCCQQADCSCCWGCAGLLNVQLNVSANLPSMIELLAFKSRKISSTTPSLYRPPILA